VHFDANAERTMATVTRKDTRDEPRGPKGQLKLIYVVYFTFRDAAGQTHEGSTEVSANDWTVRKKGDTLLIEYDRTDPSSTRLAGSGTTSHWGLIAAGFGAVVFFTVGIAIVATLLFGAARRARLVRTGTPALGAVDCVVENDSAVKLEGTFRVRYHFTDAEGTTREGRGPAQAWSRAGRYSTGESVLVLYDPANPARHEADLFEARSDELAELDQQTKKDAGAD